MVARLRLGIGTDKIGIMLRRGGRVGNLPHGRITKRTQSRFAITLRELFVGEGHEGVETGGGAGGGGIRSGSGLGIVLALLAQKSGLLEFCEFGDGTAQDEMRLRAGTVYRFLLLFGALVHHRVEIEVVYHAEGLFDEAAATESPGGSHDFGGEGCFEFAVGGEFIH